MGLRVEQNNIEDLLKYFIARNEFGRKNIVKLLEGLSDEERSKMNISNYAEFYSLYRFLYKTLKGDLINGLTAADVNAIDFNGRSYYDEEFLRKYPFECILNKRLIQDINKTYKFVYNDYSYDSISNPTWNFILDNSISSVSLTKDDVSEVNIDDYGISVKGTPSIGDIVSVEFVSYEDLTIDTSSSNADISLEVNLDKFVNHVKEISSCYYDEKTSVDTLFQKIVNSNPNIEGYDYGDKDEVNSLLIDIPMFVFEKNGEYVISGNSEGKYSLADITTLDAKLFYTSDEYYGNTEITKSAIILAALRKILDNRSIRYSKNQYIKEDKKGNVYYDVKELLNLVLNSNPLTENDLTEDEDYSFRTIENQINNLKAYVNEYVRNENLNYNNKYFLKQGVANYAGYGYCTVIPHNTGLYPITTVVNLVNAKDNNDVGDVYVKSDKENIYVYNTGKNRSEFEFTCIFDTGDYVEFPKDKTFDDFIKTCINSIEKIKLNNTSVTKNDDDTISISLEDTDGNSLYNKFDYLIVAKDRTEKYYCMGDTSLFSYDKDTKVLTILDPKSIGYEEDANYYITRMNITDAPILYLLDNLMNSPNYYIQRIDTFNDLMFVPDKRDFEMYVESLGVSGVEKLKNEENVQYFELSDYDITIYDVIFINGLAYTITDTDYFRLINFKDKEENQHHVLAIMNLNIDERDVIHLSRITENINPFDLDDNKEDSEKYEDYYFDKYVYLSQNMAFGRDHFKKDVIIEDDIDPNPENFYPLDPSTRMYKRAYNGIKYYMTYAEYKAYQLQRYDEEDKVRVAKKSGVTVVSHKLGKTPNFVVITPFTKNITADKKKHIGNISWFADDENLYVYNTGDSDCSFDWFVAYDENCLVTEKSYNDVSIIDKNKILIYNVTHKDNFSELDYEGMDYIRYNKNSNEFAIYNTNPYNESCSAVLSYITTPNFYKQPKFLQYAHDYLTNQDGYFDKDETSNPSGTTILNYSGELRATKSQFYGDGLVQYLPILKEDVDTFTHGSVVSYVDSLCKLTSNDNANTVVGVLDENMAISITDYTKNEKIPVAMFGVHDMAVTGNITAGCDLTISSIEGVLTNKTSDDEIKIARSLTSVVTNDVVTIKGILSI